MKVARLVRLGYDDEALRTVMHDGRPVVVTRGLGSGLGRAAGTAGTTLWALGDRGPNFPTAVRDTKILPAPDLGPALVELRVEDDRIERIRTLELRGADGRRLTGLPLPGDGQERALDPAGSDLGRDPMGADTEGLAVGRDGSFWVADEYGPSILRVDAGGTVRARWVPEGSAERFRGAAFEIVECLPRKAIRRRLNRGFEGLALSEDQARLHVGFQSALEGDDPRECLLWTLDARTGRFLREWRYPFDAPDSFRRDVARGPVTAGDLKLCELAAIGSRRVLVLERVSATSRLYRVDLDEGAEGDGASRTVRKTVVFDTDEYPEVDADLEGVVGLSPNSLLLANDNDFGIEGVSTRFWRVEFTDDL